MECHSLTAALPPLSPISSSLQLVSLHCFNGRVSSLTLQTSSASARPCDLSLKVQTQALALRLSSCVPLGKLVNFSEASSLCLVFAVVLTEKYSRLQTSLGMDTGVTELSCWQSHLCPQASTAPLVYLSAPLSGK